MHGRTHASRAIAVCLFITAYVALAAPPASAEPPPNDTSDAPTEVVLTSLPPSVTSTLFTRTQDTGEATTEPGQPVAECYGNHNSVWYRFGFATSSWPNLPVKISTVGSDYDTTLGLYDQDLNLIACVDDTDGLQSTASLPGQAFVPYYIMVGSYPGTPAGNLVLSGRTDFDITCYQGSGAYTVESGTSVRGVLSASDCYGLNQSGFGVTISMDGTSNPLTCSQFPTPLYDDVVVEGQGAARLSTGFETSSFSMRAHRRSPDLLHFDLEGTSEYGTLDAPAEVTSFSCDASGRVASFSTLLTAPMTSTN